MRSALSTVASRWAMTSEVRPCISRSSATCTSRSFSASRALVASSSSSSAGSHRMARAIAIRWRCPPDRRTPFSPRKVAKPSGSRSRNSVAAAASAAARTCGVAGVGPAVADVGRGVGREDHRVLRHEADPGAVGARVELGDRHAVEQDAAPGRVVVAHQELEDAGLAGAGRARPGPRSRPGRTSRSRSPSTSRSGCDG